MELCVNVSVTWLTSGGRSGKVPEAIDEYVRDNSFEKKMSFLVKAGLVTQEERNVIGIFQKSRNNIFHSYLRSPVYENEIEAPNVVEQALAAVECMVSVMTRSFPEA